MSLCATGRIISSDVDCVKCGVGVKVSGKPDVSCGNCGAHYKLIKSEMVEDKVEMEYDCVGFVCMYSTYQHTCKNSVPAPDMYCKDHSDDKAIDKVRQEIEYTERNLDSLKIKLARVEESKKVWLINQMAGIEDDEGKT